MTVTEAMRTIDAFYQRHPEQRERPATEVAKFIRDLSPDEREPLTEATRTLAQAAREKQRGALLN